jgi:hypothetical protein
MIENDWRKPSRIFIHCDCLEQVDQLARNVFQENINVLDQRLELLLFTGEKAEEIAPPGSLCL